MDASKKVERRMGPSVAVAVATYNGGRFIDQQMASIRFDGASAIDAWFSDDGSSDDTPGRLEAIRAGWRWGEATVLAGPRRGFAENFRSLMTNPLIEADMVAFCDQDDIWHERKLAAAWAALKDEAGPAMFCSRTRGVDAAGRPTGRYSPLFTREPGFRNALVENIASGNTMVFNRAAWSLLRESASRASFVYHDWWAYIVVAAAGGSVRYSPEPLVDYRQHGANTIGLGNSIGPRLRRIGALLAGGVSRNNDIHIAALRANADLLTADARGVLDEFVQAHGAAFPVSVRHLRRSGVFRQTLYGQAGLYVAASLGRL